MTAPAPKPNVKLKINGSDVEVPAGTLLIEAVKKVNAYVPYYCYHPALGNPAVCRLCMVEVQGMPKPIQPSCRLPASEGMVVSTNSPAALRAQTSSLEFHLVNHPLDCPVCDQAGECWLQDYYMQVGLYESQVKEDKVHKEKRKAIGEYVMLDQERCVLCTRCTRFTDKVTETNELGIFNRGDRDVLDVYPGRTVDNEYSGNLVDICPVGALTDRDFRFKVRVWYLKSAPSVCSGCSRGCSIDVHATSRLWHTGGKRVARYKPRTNPDVNGYWLCDEGRYSYKQHDDHRLGRFRRKAASAGNGGAPWVKLAPKAALEQLGRELHDHVQKKGGQGLGVVLTGALSNEDLFLARRLFVETIQAKTFVIGPEPDQVGEEDKILRKRDKVPNLRGAAALGFGTKTPDAGWEGLRKKLESGELWGLYVIGRDPALAWKDAAGGLLHKPAFSVFQGSNNLPAVDQFRWSLAAATHVEEDGTFTNFEGRVQRFKKAVEPLADAQSDWRIFNELLAAFGAKKPYASAGEVFAELAASEASFRGLAFDGLEPNGRLLSDAAAPAGSAR